MEKTAAFEEAVSRLYPPLRGALMNLPAKVKAGATEVRLRLGGPVSLTVGGRPVFVSKDGGVLYNADKSCLTACAEAIYESIRALCDYSVHSHQRAIAAGYIPLPGGHRAGIAGTAVTDGGEISNVRDISSINLRIARVVPGCAAEIAKSFMTGSGSIVLAGPPGSGKTTMLRETVRLLSSGAMGAYHLISVVDERCEIGGSLSGAPQFDLGCCTDLLSGYPKAAGVLTSLRVLSPEIIALDEIGDAAECAAISEGLNSGVRFIVSLHAGTKEELNRRPVAKALLDTGAFERIFLLSGAKSPGSIKEVITAYGPYSKEHGDDISLLQLRPVGHRPVGGT